MEVAEIHRRRAFAALDIERYDVAEQEARALLAIVPDAGIGHYLLSRALLGRNQVREAVAEAKAAVRCEPDEALYHHLVGWTAMWLPLTWTELESLRTAVRLKPEVLTYQLDLAKCLADKARSLRAELRPPVEAEARQVLAQLSDRAGGESWVLARLSDTYLHLGDHDLAATLARAAVAREPNDAAGWRRLSNALRQAMNFAEALEAAHEARRLEPSSAGAWYLTGTALFGLFRLDEAREAFREYDRLRPPPRLADRMHEMLRMAIAGSQKPAAPPPVFHTPGPWDHCAHAEVAIVHGDDLILRYRCDACGGVMFCACDEPFVRQFGPGYGESNETPPGGRPDVTAGFVARTCATCRGLPPPSFPRVLGKNVVERLYWRELKRTVELRLAAEVPANPVRTWPERAARIASGRDAEDEAIEAARVKRKTEIRKEVTAELKKQHRSAPRYTE